MLCRPCREREREREASEGEGPMAHDLVREFRAPDLWLVTGLMLAIDRAYRSLF